MDTVSAATGRAGDREAVRSQLRGMWASVAGAWDANAAYVDARGRHVTERMLELARPLAGERVLELACGTGGPGLGAAPLVAPRGEVVLSDVAAEMTAIASRRAAERGLRNVSVRPLDLEEIDERTGSFDVVLCREGLMLVPDPERASREIRRVLRPEGRAVMSVWGPRERNPWLAVVFDVVTAQLGAPCRRRAFRIRSPSTTRAGWRRSSQRQAWPTSTSRSSRRRTAPPRSTSGGSARPRSQGHSRGDSVRSPRPLPGRCVRVPQKRLDPTRRGTESSSRASVSSPTGPQVGG